MDSRRHLHLSCTRSGTYLRRISVREVRAVFEAQHAMIDIEPDDTCMTVYDPDSGVTEILRALAAAEGLFVWSPSCDAEALV